MAPAPDPAVLVAALLPPLASPAATAALFLLLARLPKTPPTTAPATMRTARIPRPIQSPFLLFFCVRERGPTSGMRPWGEEKGTYGSALAVVSLVRAVALAVLCAVAFITLVGLRTSGEEMVSGLRRGSWIQGSRWRCGQRDSARAGRTSLRSTGVAVRCLRSVFHRSSSCRWKEGWQGNGGTGNSESTWTLFLTIADVAQLGAGRRRGG